jgi:hypothetical protein
VPSTPLPKRRLLEEIFGRPQYNGSVQGANGALKTRPHHQAAGAGRAEVSTGADLEAAGQEANMQARPGRERAAAVGGTVEFA